MAKDTDIGRIRIYQNEKGDTKIDVYFEEDTIWMSQRNIAELYQVSKSSISEHVKHIFEDSSRSNCSEFPNSSN